MRKKRKVRLRRMMIGRGMIMRVLLMSGEVITCNEGCGDTTLIQQSTIAAA